MEFFNEAKKIKKGVLKVDKAALKRIIKGLLDRGFNETDIMRQLEKEGLLETYIDIKNQ